MPSSESQELIQELANDLANCRQNPLLSEGEFIRFCKKRDIPVFGVHAGDPSKLQKGGLLREDLRKEDGQLLYHPWLTDTSPRPLATQRVSVHWVGREP